MRWTILIPHISEIMWFFVGSFHLLYNGFWWSTKILFVILVCIYLYMCPYICRICQYGYTYICTWRWQVKKGYLSFFLLPYLSWHGFLLLLQLTELITRNKTIHYHIQLSYIDAVDSTQNIMLVLQEFQWMSYLHKFSYLPSLMLPKFLTKKIEGNKGISASDFREALVYHSRKESLAD